MCDNSNSQVETNAVNITEVSLKLAF